MNSTRSMTWRSWPRRRLAWSSVVLTMGLLVFNGCSSARPVQADALPTRLEYPDPRPPLPHPEPVRQEVIEWVVLTKTSDGAETTYFALTPEDYEKLSRNTVDILRWMEEAMWRLRYYAEEVDDTGREKDRGRAVD